MWVWVWVCVMWAWVCRCVYVRQSSVEARQQKRGGNDTEDVNPKSVGKKEKKPETVDANKKQKTRERTMPQPDGS